MPGHRAGPVIAGGVIGIALAVLALLFSERHFHDKTSDFTQAPRLLPEADAAIAHVLMHWVPTLAPIVDQAYGDFLAALDSDVEVTLVAPEPFSSEQRRDLDAFVWRVDPTGKLARRVHVVTVRGPITTWSKDRALVTVADSKGAARLIVPAEPGAAWRERHNDWATAEQIARSSSGRFRVEVAPFDFDAGDFEVTADSVLVDTNLLEKNRHRGYDSLAQLSARLSQYLQTNVVGLGKEFGDTPRHHLSMYLTPLTGRTVLVGDPRMAAGVVGDKWAPGDSSPETDTPLVADFSPATIERFDRAARELTQHGFEVVRIPNVPFDDKTYIAYTNGVYEVRDGHKRAYMPVYGVEALDSAARAIYERLGWQVIPVRVRNLYAYHGTIGCVVNVLRRRSAP